MKWILAHKLILSIIVGVLALGGGATWYFVAKNQVPVKTVVVTRGTLIQEVNVTGKTKPVESVELAFERGGRVKEVAVKAGDEVTMGQVLLRLDDTELQAQVAQAQAGLRNAQAQRTQLIAALAAQMAKYDELKKGTRGEELQLAQNAVTSAQQMLDDARANALNLADVNNKELARAQESLSDATTSYNDAVNKSQVDLSNVYRGVEDVIRDAYNKAADAVNKQTDDLFSNDTTFNPKLTFSSGDTQAQTDAEALRYSAGDALAKISSDLAALPTDQGQLDAVLVRTKTRLELVKKFLARTNDTLAGSPPLSASTIATYKTNLSTALTAANAALNTVNTRQQTIAAQKQTSQSTVNSAKTQLNTAKQTVEVLQSTQTNSLAQVNAKVKDAENALKNAKDQLSLKQAGATSEQLKAQDAAVSQARANVLSQDAQIQSAQSNIQYNESQLAKTLLTSPLTGIVTKQDAKVGEIIAPNVTLVSLMSDKQFEIEANVPESDVQRVEVGQDVKITFDALAGKDFVGKVASIDPAETIVDGVVNFKLRVALSKDGGVRSGMTANLSIQALKKEDVLIVPQVAVIENDAGIFVKRLLKSGEVEQIAITIGARGKNGDVEVLTGVVEGDEVVDISIKPAGK